MSQESSFYPCATANGYASPAKNPTLVLQSDDRNKSLRASYTNASIIIKHELAEADSRQ
ncbi:predicted protein [Botrytis cinerea T4]|uniref:Uncharacterized protein n=1 Tax=Botryotinia fuckeliana (strain T4) TaxID=999810 RepID=G2XWJ1_BOTF4|nr:predicted protein [Botrytis cinerea T4]